MDHIETADPVSIDTIRRIGAAFANRDVNGIVESFAEEAGVEAGSEVVLSVHEGGLYVKPARRRKIKLRELLRHVTSKNLHGEIETGPAVGKEVW